jgi:hypothetical protein
VIQKVPVTDLPVGVAEQKLVTPTRFEVTTEPNPFRGRARISYAVPYPGRVALEVFDLTGRSVAIPVDGFRAAGRYSATLSAKGLVPGVYIARLSSGGRCLSRKLVLTQ